MDNINNNLLVVLGFILLLHLVPTESRKDGDVWLIPRNSKINSTYSHGILYILHDGEWGTVCNDGWNMDNSQVVCKALGHARAVAHKHMGEGTGKILLSGVQCSGSEASVANCKHSGWGNTSKCNHKQDVGIVCQAATVATVRLGGGNTLEGRVEVRYKGEWGTICNDGWNINSANVICKMLGHKKAIKIKRFGSGSGRIWLDDVSCKGTEMSIDKCHHRGWGVHNCKHDEDSGVMCLPRGESIVSVRLADGDLPNAGRVEIRFHGVWKSVCDTKWDIREAHVICRMLGYGEGAAVAIKGYQSTGDVWLSGVSCHGHEKSIERCVNLRWGKASCRKNRRAGVVCISGSPELAYRLVDGGVSHVGRLETFYYGIWGTVCADTISLQDAHVVCRMMGYARAVAIYKQSGNSFKFLTVFNCNGTENSTEQCDGAEARINTCRSKKDTWIVCKPNIESKTATQARLAGGSSPNEGRLEIQQYGVWGTVCNSGWSIMNANVACRMMNFTGAIPVKQTFGFGTGPIWLTGLKCKGEEKDLLECSDDGLGQTGSCSHGNDVGVVCHSYPAHDPNMAVRLVDGYSPNRGRVEVRYYGIWGTICDDLWGLEDAHVVCRMLYYSKASWAGTADVSGRGYILLDNVQCHGNEKSLEYCGNDSLGQHDCGHKEDAGVMCENLTQDELAVNVRLINNQRNHVGFVEVNYNGTWRPVCDDTWDISGAHVVCRMLGYKAAQAPIRQYRQGIMSGLWMGGVVCRGDEQSISECYHRGWTNTRCPGNHHAGVMCKVDKELPSIQVRLEEGTSPNSGRVAVRYGNVWGTICNRGLDVNDAKVICRMLGYPGASKVYPRSTFRPGNGTIWLSNLECNGTEKTIADCPHPGWGQTVTCNHDNDVAVMCKIADAPGIQINGTGAITESTVIMLFNDSQQIEAYLKSVYQVAVEKKTTRHRLKSYDQPPPFVFNDLNVTMATQMANDSYVTAEIPAPLSSLTIGDGQYYHGYYNAPLEPGSMYRVHVRVVTMAIDGKRIHGKSAFVAFTTVPLEEVRIRYYKDRSEHDAQDRARYNKVAVIALSLVIVVLLIVIMAAVVWHCYKKRTEARRKCEGFGPRGGTYWSPRVCLSIYGIYQRNLDFTAFKTAKEHWDCYWLEYMQAQDFRLVRSII